MDFRDFDPDELAEAWVTMTRKTRCNQKVSDTDLEKGSRIWELDRVDPDIALDVITKILQICKNDIEISNNKILLNGIIGELGAGPFEEILHQHWDVLVDKVIFFAKNDNMFNIMVKSAWKGDIPDDVWDRLKSQLS